MHSHRHQCSWARCAARCDKRAAILFGLVVDQLPTKEKISERGKDMLDKALELEPTEFALLHPFVPVSPSPWQTCRGSRERLHPCCTAKYQRQRSTMPLWTFKPLTSNTRTGSRTCYSCQSVILLRRRRNKPDMLDKALELEPTDFALLHLRARFSFTLANLSWLERKAVSMLYSELRKATIGDGQSENNSRRKRKRMNQEEGRK
ncbi:unnamed protein product [Caenorhabditis nigoni]